MFEFPNDRRMVFGRNINVMASYETFSLKENGHMSLLAKLTIKPVARATQLSPIEMRRKKLCNAIDEQIRVADAVAQGQEHTVSLSRWAKNEAGERVRVQRQKVVKPWFFAHDDGIYVQCKYGSRVISLSKDGNAILVKDIAAVKTALETLREAVRNGELDGQIDTAIKAKRQQSKAR
jgi:hypothetical protein